jgi:penicillin-binding protein 2
MLIFDELKKNDLQLRTVAMVLAGGLFILLVGLWWVQVVSSREYQNHLETQSYRSIRLPAVRGKILDRTGVNVLAENRPRYNLSLYLDDLRPQFDDAFTELKKSALAAQKQRIAAQEKKLRRPLTKAELKQFRLTTEEWEQLRTQARVGEAASVVAEVGRWLGQPLTLDAAKFNRHYATELAMPYPILPNLTPEQIARFEEHFAGGLGADLEPQSVRVYPFGDTAAHLLGYLQKDDSSAEGEESFFNYRLPDYRGKVGIEGGFDTELRGHAGEESVLVNNLGYRETNNVPDLPEAGHNVVLTLDLNIQRAAEESLARHQGSDVKGAIVVMDVRNGDVLAMVSSPAINPDYVSNNPAYLADPELRPQINRATQENYAPGSIFKVVVGLAALENGLDPEQTYEVQSDPTRPGRGCIYIGKRKIDDTAPPGEYNFKLALERSSNAYFITNGLHTGIENIVRLAEKFHFGEKLGLPTRQETRGNLPSLARVQSDWHDGDTANFCIGQGAIVVTPLQMAVAYAAIANGGSVLVPRLVERIEPQDPASGESATNFPAGVIRDQLGVRPRSLKILHDAMLAETEEPEGTGHPAAVAGLRICGKTGTAQVMNERNEVIDHTTWFASFAPYEHPRYAVVVMVQGGSSGGGTCAPIAHDIYEAILKNEKSEAPKVLAEN